MATDGVRFTTKELSTETWSDFERLFSQGGGWDFCACMLAQRGCHLSGEEFRTRAAARVRNLEQKRELVERGLAHGILVYAGDGEPVGWCQYGPVDELPVPGLETTGRKIIRAHDPTSRWRITCFVTHKRHRRRGVASLALAAAVESIQNQGGGWTEATPIALAHQPVDRRLRELLRSHGRRSPQVERYLANRPGPEVEVTGVGRVKAVRGSFGNVSTTGTLSMFQRHGFRPVRLIGDSRVLVRREI